MQAHLRTHSFIDALQPQLAGFLQTVSRGFQPLERQASIFVEISPGIAINELTDVALKATRVMPGMQIVERAYGMVELHHFDQGEVRAAGRAILERLGCEESARLKPTVVSSEVIRAIEGHQEMLINRMRHGDLIREGETLYVLETHPAGYAAIAANEAEKAAPIRLLDVRTFGAFGRLYLSGGEAEIDEAVAAIMRTLESIDGRVDER